MAKHVSTHSAKSKAASSASRSRGARAASSRSAKQTRAKRGAIASANEARAAKIDWAKVDATAEAAIARQALNDRTATPPERAWKKMVRDGAVLLVPPAEVDVRGIREKLQLSQSAFAARFGFTAAVRQWEQGRRQPHGPARVLLTIIAREPNAVRRALEAAE